MPVWTVHAPPSPSGISAQPEDLVFIREGFSWTALIFAPVWAVVNRLWLALVAWISAVILISIAGIICGDAVVLPLWVGFLVWYAFEARDFRRAKLRWSDWRFVGVVEARSTKLAEQRYFEKILRAEPSTPPPLPIDLPASRPPPIGAFPPVVGYSLSERL